MTNNNPITVDGKVYDEYAMSLALSPLFRDNFLSASVVLTLEPLRRENDVFETLQAEYRKTIVFGDVFASNDPQVLTAVGKVQAALQELIDLKGL